MWLAAGSSRRTERVGIVMAERDRFRALADQLGGALEYPSDRDRMFSALRAWRAALSAPDRSPAGLGPDEHMVTHQKPGQPTDKDS